MSDSISWEDEDFLAHMSALGPEMIVRGNKAVDDVAIELLRLSQMEVPLGLSKGEGGNPEDGHPGVLQNSGEWHHEGELQAQVGYHTPYAHRLHEHPEYNFNHGRKGKYLEDPMKNNLMIFRNYFIAAMRGGF